MSLSNLILREILQMIVLKRERSQAQLGNQMKTFFMKEKSLLWKQELQEFFLSKAFTAALFACTSTTARNKTTVKIKHTAFTDLGRDSKTTNSTLTNQSSCYIELHNTSLLSKHPWIYNWEFSQTIAEVRGSPIQIH